MPQGGPWSRMLSGEFEIDDIGISPSQSSAPKKKAIRAANYSLDEDIQLCESWENISLDPITGNEQPGKAYWKRIHDNFHANKNFASDRNANSLEHRWATIHKECQKFQGLYDEVERRHPSGVPYQEHVRNLLVAASLLLEVAASLILLSCCIIIFIKLLHL